MQLLFILLVIILFSSQHTYSQWVTKIETGNRVMAFTVNGTSVYSAVESAGVYRTDDKGETWVNLNQGLPETDLTSITLFKGVMFVSTSERGIYRSTDNGDLWTPMNDGLTTLNTFALASDDSFVYAGTYNKGIFKSSNLTNWFSSGEGLTSQRIYSIVYANGKLYAGTGEGQIFISSNHGETWDSAGSSFSTAGLLGLTVSGNNIYAGTAGDGIFVTSDNGSNWTPINNGLNTYIWDVVVYNEQLFAATSGGVFTSIDNGANWSAINEGLDGGTFGDIIYSMSNDDEYLYAGNGWSILRRPLSEVTDVEDVRELPAGFFLEQNYPNPFNPATIIEYSVPAAEKGSLLVQLKIFDILGNELDVILNEEKPAGIYKISYDASHLSSGTYFYRLIAGEYSETKKMILIR